MGEEELLEIIRENLKDMKLSIDMNTYFEIDSKQAKEFYFAITTIITLKQKEIEEKTTILLAGAKKVKQLEKEIEELKKENNEIWGHLPRLD